MRKLQLFGLVGLLAIVLTTAPAGAFTFEVGNNLGKLVDYGSFFEPDEEGPGATPLAIGDFLEGDWDQTLFSVTNLYQPPQVNNANEYYDGTPELIGLVYDLKIQTGGITVLRAPGTNSGTDPGKFEINLVSAGRYATSTDAVASIYPQGRVDLWVDAGTPFDPAVPSDWGYGAPGAAGWDTNPFDAGEFDTFPTASDGTPLLSLTFVEPDPVNKPGVLLTLTLDFEIGSGDAGIGYLHVVYNPTGIPFLPRFLGGLAEISFENDFTFYPSDGLFYDGSTDGADFDAPGGDIYWDSSSEDPIRFTVLPEPATMSLLGMALVGLGGRVLRRRSK